MPVLAQENSLNRAAAIKRALQRAEFQIAADLADSAIARFREYLPAPLAEIHALRALVYFEQNNIARAEEHLALALQLDSNLALDPVFFSPQIQKLLEELRPRVATLGSAPARTVRYVIVADPRLEAAWRSLLLPGWGQRFKGQKTKGRVFSIAAAALAGATVTGHLLRARAEKNYLNAGDNEVKRRYNIFNRYHLLRNNLALALGLVWSVGILDALIIRVEPTSNPIGLASPRDGATGLCLRISF